MTQKYLPESMYFIDPKLARENITIGDIVTAKVICYKDDKKLLVVNLGKDYGVISLEETTIYPKYHPSGILHGSVYSLIGKTIRAKVISIDDEIRLSRKVHMIEALNYFKANNLSIFENASITAFSRLCAFIDIGAGIIGRIAPLEFSTTFFNDIRDVGLEVGDIISVSNIGYNKKVDSFNLSRKDFL